MLHYAVPDPPAVVPPYGCADKTPTFAYATSTCSVSFYTCASTTSPPNPGVINNKSLIYYYICILIKSSNNKSIAQLNLKYM